MASTNVVTRQEAGPQKRGFSRFWRAVKQLFHEVVGAVFAVLAFAWIQSGVRAWTHDAARWLVATALGVAVAMALFSWGSFRRARQLQRQGP